MAEQLPVAGDEQALALAAEVEGDPGLLQEGGRLQAQLAAEPGQVHGHGAEGAGLLSGERAQAVQVAHQTANAVKTLIKRVDTAAGLGVLALGVLGDELELNKNLLQKLPQLPDKAVQLAGGDGGGDGRVEQQQLALLQGQAAVEITHPLKDKAARRLGVFRSLSQAGGERVALAQKGEALPGGAVQGRDRTLIILDGPVGEILQQGKRGVRHDDLLKANGPKRVVALSIVRRLKGAHTVK